uniref:Uncharacterized protein n=1 Tax=Arundo donax TaxID=35708 RepID=A0A0A8YKA1_ARUDO
MVVVFIEGSEHFVSDLVVVVF